MIKIWGGDERGQGGSGLLQAVVRWHGDLVRDWSGNRTSPETPSPLPDVQLFSQVSLLEARKEELHQG